jgi:cell division protease FtsH
MDQLAMMLGGRAAEELVFSEITTGAANDLERATAMSRQMITRFGMSEKLGPRVFGSDPHQPFLGRELGTEPSYSEEMAQEIDEEIYRLIDDAHQRAARVLVEHQHALHEIAAILIEHETIDKEQFERLLHGEPEQSVLAHETPPTTPTPEPQRKRARKPRPSRTPAASPTPGAAAARAVRHDDL